MPARAGARDLFRSLPTELLVEIFTQRVALEIPQLRNEFYTHQSRESDGTLAPLHQSVIALSSVCQRWRAIVLNTAYFWSFIAGGSDATEMDLAQIRMYLHRSKQAPLFMSFHLKGCICRLPGTPGLSGVLQLMAPHADRIQEIMVVCNHKKVALGFFEALLKWKKKLPTLQRIALYANPRDLAASREYVPSHPEWLVFPTGFAPRLHTLKLAWFNLPGVGVSFEELKALHLSNVTQSQHLSPQALGLMLSRCRGLQTLEIDRSFGPPLDLEPQPVLMESLKVLSVTMCCEIHSKQWTRVIRAPILDQLCLHVDLAPSGCASLQALCTAAGAYPSVRTLRIYQKATIHPRSISDDEWKNLAKASLSNLGTLYFTMPHVTELTIHCGNLPMTGLRSIIALNYVATTTHNRQTVRVIPFPRLRFLEVHNLSLERNELELIAGVLDRRTKYLRGRRLASLRISGSKAYSESERVWATLAPLVDEFAYAVSRETGV